MKSAASAVNPSCSDMDKIVAIVPTSKGNQVLKLPIKTISSFSGNGKKIQVATITQVSSHGDNLTAVNTVSSIGSLGSISNLNSGLGTSSSITISSPLVVSTVTNSGSSLLSSTSVPQITVRTAKPVSAKPSTNKGKSSPLTIPFKTKPSTSEDRGGISLISNSNQLAIAKEPIQGIRKTVNRGIEAIKADQAKVISQAKTDSPKIVNLSAYKAVPVTRVFFSKGKASNNTIEVVSDFAAANKNTFVKGKRLKIQKLPTTSLLRETLTESAQTMETAEASPTANIPAQLVPMNGVGSEQNSSANAKKSENLSQNGRESPSSDFDPIEAMDWKDGVGFLPGSNFRFKINEFGLLELLCDNETNDLEKSQETLPERQVDEQLCPEVVTCANCGRQGELNSFIRKGRFCSQSCATIQSSQLRGLRKPGTGAVPPIKRKISSVANVEGPKSLRTRKTSLDKYIYTDETGPVTLATANEEVQDVRTRILDGPERERFFSWKDYLAINRSCCAPTKLFTPAQMCDEKKNCFRVNMKLEGIDPQHPSLFCVLSVVEVRGQRIRMHFDGYSADHDFWSNCDSPFIFPAGWCAKTNRKLQPPKHMSRFDWSSYLQNEKAKAAPKQCFTLLNSQQPPPSGYKVGMKLEAVDKANSSLVCVASIADIIGNWLLIHFDGWDDSYDYWTEASSPHIHPINWCRGKGKALTPPKDYSKSSDKFNWNDYLQEQKATFVPSRAFRTRAANQFKVGMKLEAVDKRNPRCVRVATIVNRQSFSVKIHFDNWDSKYDYWVDDDSHDLHPVNWCQKTGHWLEEPPPCEYDAESHYNRCPIFGCKGIGHLRDSNCLTHDAVENCPYAEENIDHEPLDRFGCDGEESDSSSNLFDGRSPPLSDLVSDRLSPIISKEEEPKIKREDDSDESGKTSRSVTPTSEGQEITLQKSMFEVRAQLTAAEEAPIDWERHSVHLAEYVQGLRAQDVLSWDCDQVAAFIATLPGCMEFADRFKDDYIDGRAFLLLTQADIVKILGIKLGPAVKIYNSVLIIRKSIMNSQDAD